MTCMCTDYCLGEHLCKQLTAEIGCFGGAELIVMIVAVLAAPVGCFDGIIDCLNEGHFESPCCSDGLIDAMMMALSAQATKAEELEQYKEPVQVLCLCNVSFCWSTAFFLFKANVRTW